MTSSKNNPSNPDFAQLHRSIQNNTGFGGISEGNKSFKPIIYRSFNVWKPAEGMSTLLLTESHFIFDGYFTVWSQI